MKKGLYSTKLVLTALDKIKKRYIFLYSVSSLIFIICGIIIIVPFRNTPPGLSAPLLKYPSNNLTLTQKQLQFSWSHVENAYEYILKINDEIEPPTTNLGSLKTNLVPGTYKWAVMAENGENKSPWSEERIINIKNPGPILKIELISPLKGLSITENIISFRWRTNNSPPDLKYKFEMSFSEKFDKFEFPDSDFTSASYEINHEVLKDNHKYFWRIVAYNGSNILDTSEIWYFIPYSPKGPIWSKAQDGKSSVISNKGSKISKDMKVKGHKTTEGDRKIKVKDESTETKTDKKNEEKKQPKWN